MRSLYIIGGASIVAIVLGCLLYFFGPPSLRSEVNTSVQSSAASEQAALDSVSFSVLEQGQDAISITARTNYRIDSESELQSLWPLIYGDRDAPNVPSVDFTKYEVLVVFDGTHSTNGYNLSIKQITDQNQTRTVVVSHFSPSSSCTTQNMASSPFEMVEVPKTSFTLAHEDLNFTSSSCPAQ